MPPELQGIQRELWPAPPVEPLRLRRAPLLAAGICFALGIVAAHRWQPPVLLLCAVVLLSGLTILGLRGRAYADLFATAALWIVAGIWCAEIQPAPPSQQPLFAFADGLSRTVRGRVVQVRVLPGPATEHDGDADPTLWLERPPEAAGVLSVDLALDAVEQVTPDESWMEPITGGVRMTIVGDLAPPVCGEVLEAPLRLKVPERYRDPGAWQYADYLLEQGIGTHANVKAARVQRLGSAPPTWTRGDLLCRIHAAQRWAAGRMQGFVHARANHVLPAVARLSDTDAGMLDAMLFGDRTLLTHTLRLGFERTGSFHLFVVSGMHVALLAGGVFFLATRLRLRDWLATTLTLLLTAAYAVFTGFGAPVQRALAMTTIFLLARLLSRERSVLNALGAAALGVLAWSPRGLFEASFQMTFLVIVAIGGIAVPLGERSFLPYAHAARKIGDRWLDIALPPKLAQLRVMLRLWGDALAAATFPRIRGLPAALLCWTLWAVELAVVGVVAEMVMILPMALYFHRATVFALPANMLSIPLVAVLAPMAIVTFVASLISPWLALLPGGVTALLLHGIVTIIGGISRVRAADACMPAPVWWIALLALAAWAFCCWAVRQSGQQSGRWAWLAAAVLPLTALAILWPESPRTVPNELEVTAIDVGQGDSLFLCGPTGETMLLDAGGPTGAVKETAEATSRFDVGEEVVSPFLWSRHIRRLDVLALSHAHSDHMGGMAAVMRNFRPRELWVSIDPDSTAFRALLDEAAQLGVTVRHLHAGDAFPWAGTSVDVFAPEAAYQNAFTPANNDSLVFRLQYGQASVLLEGDAEAASERAMLESGLMKPVTLLKVGHHGSRTSSSDAFVEALAPRDAVISVGKGNTFGHPRGEVIQRFAAAGTHLYRTDEFGLVTFMLRPDGSIHEVFGNAVPGAAD